MNKELQNISFRMSIQDLVFKQVNSEQYFKAILQSIGIYGNDKIIDLLITAKSPNDTLRKYLSKGIDKVFFGLSIKEVKECNIRQLAKYYLMSKRLKQGRAEWKKYMNCR